MQWLIRPFPYRIHRHSAVYVLIGINIAVFILQRFMPLYYLALNADLIVQKNFVWTFVTYMFAHGGFSHLFFNMLGLYFFGMPLERTWGSDEFIFMYLVIGILAGVFSFFVYMFTSSVSVFLLGASGAVFGITLIFACLYPNTQIYILGVFPISARVFMLIYIAIQLWSLGSGTRSGVAYLTHLAGVGVAWVYLLVRHGINPYDKLFRRS